jgi:glycosyltransferase involved in cell wall biosynthesis
VKVLFLLAHCQLAASARFRVYQYLSYLREHGVECDVRPFVTEEVFHTLRDQGGLLHKARLFSARSVSRWLDLRAARDYDVIFVQRESFPVGPPLVERHLATLGRPIVYDFDDAIYLPLPSPISNLLRQPGKVTRIIQLAQQVIVSTEHLRGFAVAYNSNVTIIPTSVDTHREFTARAYPAFALEKPVRIGWIGSTSTAAYLDRVLPVLANVARKCRIEVLVVGAGRDVAIPGARVENLAWSLEAEADHFRSLDIGLYPLDDGVWELGKGGFKAIQYMASAVPCVVSPVGVVRDIVADGEQGFHAESPTAWERRILELASDPAMRRRMGEAGRRQCESRFSVQVNAPRLLSVLKRAAQS